MQETADVCAKKALQALTHCEACITEDIWSEILHISVETIGAQAGTFWFYHRFGDGLIRPMAVHGGGELEKIYMLPGEGVAGIVIDKGESILISDCRRDPRWTKKVDVETGFITESTLCVPVKVHGMTFGCIQLLNKVENREFTQSDMQALELIAERASAMLSGHALLGRYHEVGHAGGADPEDDNERSFIKRLSAYMDPAIIHEILRSDGKHKKSIEPQDAVVLFADIRGFTRLAQRISSSQLISTLSDFLAITSHQIHRYGGVIDKFMGDCTMAYWCCEGDPEAPLEACRCALAIQREAVAFGERLFRQAGIRLGIGIGLHKGPVLLCHVGDEQYMAYTAIGSSVNTACRIEEHAPSGTVYISGDLAEALGELAETVPVRENIQWRDKDDRLVILELQGLPQRQN